jgi:uncharacterized repeat protein (TIGR03803 family)
VKAISKSLGALAFVTFLTVITAQSAQSQTFTVLHFFSYADGGGPNGTLIQATDGAFYGTTVQGGADGYGTVFKINSGGKFTMLHSFDATDGDGPTIGLIQATDGEFYGATLYGGVHNLGTIFKLDFKGTLTTLHAFDGTDGQGPWGLIQATDGDLYGTTGYGGADNYGTVFEITCDGKLTTLHSFVDADGVIPVTGVIEATNGDFYGTTTEGGPLGPDYQYGTVYRITPGGKLTVIASFDYNERYPSGLLQAADGNFYGTSVSEFFEVTPRGILTTPYTFTGYGQNPYMSLIQATDGNFYGTTVGGGAYNAGSVFQLTPSGVLTTLYSFCPEPACTDGSSPIEGLIQGTDGDFYGSAESGGAGGYGSVFKLSMGLKPFVALQTTSGPVGSSVKILGSTLEDVTSVTFNHVAASFAVTSKYELNAQVPLGATTGRVEVTAAGGILKSNKNFVVIQ